MTLDELRGRVPEMWRPVVDQYGPALVSMGVTELWAWIGLLAKGDEYAAYRQLIDRLPAAEALAEGDSLIAGWETANKGNAERLSLQRSALAAILRVLLAAALALVGL